MWSFIKICLICIIGIYRLKKNFTEKTGILLNYFLLCSLWILNFCRFWPIMQIRKKGGWNKKNIFSSETTEPISTKLCWNDSWMVPFQNCVRWSRLPTKMAAKLKIEKRGDEILIVHCCFSVSQKKQKWTIKIPSPLFLFWAWWPSWLEVGITGHNFGRGPSKKHFSKVWLRLAQ
jgi:hypothetical protein